MKKKRRRWTRRMTTPTAWMKSLSSQLIRCVCVCLKSAVCPCSEKMKARCIMWDSSHSGLIFVLPLATFQTPSLFTIFLIFGNYHKDTDKDIFVDGSSPCIAFDFTNKFHTSPIGAGRLEWGKCTRMLKMWSVSQVIDFLGKSSDDEFSVAGDEGRRKTEQNEDWNIVNSEIRDHC